MGQFSVEKPELPGSVLSGNQQPLLKRKARLEKLLPKTSAEVRFNGHLLGNGPRMYVEAAKFGLEGIISKLANRPYMPGNRGVLVKTKYLNRQEFVIVGWTDPEGSRSSIGSLLLGYYDDGGKLIYAGRVGTGFTETAEGAPQKTDAARFRQDDSRCDTAECLALRQAARPGARALAAAEACRGSHHCPGLPTTCCVTSSMRASARTRLRGTSGAGARRRLWIESPIRTLF